MKPLPTLLLAPLLLCGCDSLFPPKPTLPPEYSTVKGKAIIAELHSDLHYAIINTDFGPLKIWWDESSKFFYGASQVQSLAIKPGDTIMYNGVIVSKEIFVHQLILPPK